jgi:hypothetical protein
MPEAVYTREADDRFVPTELATGPWSPESQHGGPPAALLGRAVEKFEADDAWFVARMTVELLRPVPLAPLVVSTRLVRPGKRVQLVEASLRAGDVEVTRAVGLRLRTGGLELPPLGSEDTMPLGAEGAVPPPPDDLDPPQWPPMEWTAFGEAMDMRVVSGTFRQPGPATIWFRLRVPLVEGEETSPLSRVLAAADFGNGISSVLDWDNWSFVNPDLTVYLHRAPVDDWVCLDARTWVEPQATGFAESALYDRNGRIGRSLQSLVLGPR